jgi:hypothetical protein
MATVGTTGGTCAEVTPIGFDHWPLSRQQTGGLAAGPLHAVDAERSDGNEPLLIALIGPLEVVRYGYHIGVAALNHRSSAIIFNGDPALEAGDTFER